MSKRTPPSAEQIVEALRRAGGDERLFTEREAIGIVRSEFRTTYARADEWLYTVAPDEGSALWRIYVSEHGTPMSIVLHNRGAQEYGDPATHPYVRSIVGSKGVTDHVFPDAEKAMMSTQCGPDGRFISRSYTVTKGQGIQRVPRMPEGIAYGTTSGLRHLHKQALQHDAEEKVQSEAGKILEQAHVSREHGEAIDYIRGLLSAAGIGLRDDAFSPLQVHATAVHRNEEVVTSVEVRLRDSQIDRLADVLKRLGVQPEAAA